MKRVHSIVWVFLIFSTHTAFSQAPQQFSLSKNPEEVGFSTERLSRLDAYFSDLVKTGQVSNTVAFVAKNGKIAYFKSFGFSNLEKKTPVQNDAIFRIASQSKAITTCALMMLFEEGKFLLEDPVSKYIPEFKNPRVLEKHDPVTGEYITRPAKSEITIAQLLTHTAGIPYEHPLEKLAPYNKIPYLHSTEPLVLKDVVSWIAARPLLHDPGESFTYGLNTDIAGRLVEILSGLSLDAFFRTRIFEPLGMKDTYFYLPEDKAGRLVELYSKTDATAPLTLHAYDLFRNYAKSGARTYFSGGAGLVSTAEDYAKFCQMILNGGSFNDKQLLGRKTVGMMLSNQTGDIEVWDRKGGYTYGFQHIGPESRYGDQASPGSVTWGGFYCSEYTIDPAENLIMLVFTNVQPIYFYGEYVRKFRILAYQALK